MKVDGSASGMSRSDRCEPQAPMPEVVEASSRLGFGGACEDTDQSPATTVLAAAQASGNPLGQRQGEGA